MISTDRLDLVPATIPTVRAALEDPERLGVLLDARVPDSWPPDLLDVSALEWTLGWLRTEGNDPRWGFYWMVLCEPESRVLIGTTGYKGNPTPDGTLEIGYGVVTDHQCRGYATEATRALVDHAFGSPDVTRVIAETLPDLEASKRVLEKCGFEFLGEGSETWAIRYELRRP